MRTLSDTPINLDLNPNDESVETYKVYSDSMKNVYNQVAELAPGSGSVIIVGELGTGKKRLARLLHSLSPFSSGPFQIVHHHSLEELMQLRIVALEGLPEPESFVLLEDLGIDIMSGGSLFFDLFSDLNPSNQQRMIELLYEAVMRAVNQNNTKFRLIFSIASSSDKEPFDSPYWKDLMRYFKPSVIHVPPLRERCEDITLLIDQFLLDHARKNLHPVNAISYRAAYKCISYHWPGNVQQLKNVVEHAVTIVPPGSVITTDLLPFSIDWKSSSSYINMTGIDDNESFLRAEKLLLNELVSKTDLTQQQLEKVEHEFRFPHTN